MSENQQRLALSLHVIDQVMAEHGRSSPDAIVLPGGMFRLRSRFAHLSEGRRLALLNKQPFVAGIVAKLRQFPGTAPLVVFGINARLPSHQACLAVSKTGIDGLAVKHFFLDHDRDRGNYPVTDARDFRTMRRFVRLRNGSVASLSDCYDMFGLREDPAYPGLRMQAIRRIREHGRVVGERDRGFTAAHARIANDWWVTRRQASPDVAIAVIHTFASPGREGLWQRHGIAAASAFLRGGLAVGASHFSKGLPSFHAPLAARGVPKSELTAGLHRRAHHLRPRAVREVVMDGQIVAVLRLFIGNRPKKRR